jgi:hypothetical protein
MPVPKLPIPPLGSCFRRLLALALFVVAVATPLLARSSDPPLRIPLDPLGFQPLPPQFLLAGSSLLTLHYVDDTHLLITFNVHRLLSRLPDDPEDDQDHNVDVLLLELPTGRVLAHTSWRLHDHGQYLWNLGRGRFLLRIRDTVTFFAPLANLASGEPFRQQAFLNTDNRRIAVIDISPDNTLLTVETVKRTPPVPRPKTPLFGPTPPAPAPQFTSVQINFYRIPQGDDATQNLHPIYAGILRTNGTGTIPALGAGYLAVIDEGHQHWAFDFHSFAGKTLELSPFDSVCRPIPRWVSRSQFIAFGCRTGSSRQLLGSFNLRGQEPWEQGLFGEYINPSISISSSRGRFALGRVMVHTAVTPEQMPVPDQMGAQTVVVYQAESGRQLLHAECSPVEPAGQNFSLSPDGLSLALVHDDAIEVYRLPELTDKESAEVKLAQADVPEDSGLPVQFTAAIKSQEAEANSGTEAAAPPAAASMPSTPVAPSAPPAGSSEETPTVALGDPQPGNQPRQRPTLYTLPTDSPHPRSDDQPQ